MQMMILKYCIQMAYFLYYYYDLANKKKSVMMRYVCVHSAFIIICCCCCCHCCQKKSQTDHYHHSACSERIRLNTLSVHRSIIYQSINSCGNYSGFCFIFFKQQQQHHIAISPFHPIALSRRTIPKFYSAVSL